MKTVDQNQKMKTSAVAAAVTVNAMTQLQEKKDVAAACH